MTSLALAPRSHSRLPSTGAPPMGQRSYPTPRATTTSAGPSSAMEGGAGVALLATSVTDPSPGVTPPTMASLQQLDLKCVNIRAGARSKRRLSSSSSLSANDHQRGKAVLTHPSFMRCPPGAAARLEARGSSTTAWPWCLLPCSHRVRRVSSDRVRRPSTLPLICHTPPRPAGAPSRPACP